MIKLSLISEMLNRNGQNNFRENSLELYRGGEMSLWKATEIAGITYRAKLEELKKRKIPFQYDKENLGVYIQ